MFEVNWTIIIELHFPAIMYRSGGGHSTSGYAPCAKKRPYSFSLAFTERPPFLPTLTQWPPIFNKLLVTEKPWHIFVTQRPLIFTFNSQTSDNFWQNLDFFRKFRHIWQNVEKFLAILALSLKNPLFWHNLSPKGPYVWGAWWHSYITFICECPRV